VTGVASGRFDGRRHRFIHRRRRCAGRRALGGALGLTLRATLGIPRLSVRAVTVCIGTDRLARALGARRQGLAIGSEARLARLRALLRLLLAGRAQLLRTVLARATPTAATTETTRATVITMRAARATRSTTAAVIATRAIAARATGATAATRATPAATIATAEITRRRRQLPADTGARHLTATRAIVTVGLRLGLRVAELQAAEAARLRGTTVAAAEPAATAGTTAAIATATTTAITSATTVVAAIIATALRAGDAIDHVVELAAADRAVRAFLTLEHADQANLVDAIADDVERFDQALRAIGLNADGFGHGLDDRVVLGGRRRRSAFGLHRLGLATLTGVARVRRFRTAFDGRSVVLGSGHRRRFDGRRIRLATPTGCSPSGGGLAKG